jgi:hypothetical protein
MEDRPKPPPSAASPSVCRSCGGDLSKKGVGRYLLACGPVCTACYDAGYRGPPEKKAP